MKRTATALALLTGFGGGCSSYKGADAPAPRGGGFGTVTRPAEAPHYVGPMGESVPMDMPAARGAMPGGPSGVKPAGGKTGGGSGVVRAHVTSASMGGEVRQVNGPGGPLHLGGTPGILPVPGMGPPGAVAATGALVPGRGPAVTNQRTAIKFTGPAGMKITWQLPHGGFNDEASGLTAPADYNFLQGQVYRLRLGSILPNYPGRAFFPTLQVEPANPKTITFLAHSSVPVTFEDEDFRQAASGNMVVKVVYLPDPSFQDFTTVAGVADTIVSTRLEPGADPVAEAQRRGSVLAVIRLGNLDLENRASPAMGTGPGGVMVPPPGAVPVGQPVMMGGPALPPGTATVGGPAAPTAPTAAKTSPVLAAPVAPGSLPPVK